MQKAEQLYEGKAKKVFKTEEPEVLIVSYKDDAKKGYSGTAVFTKKEPLSAKELSTTK